MPLTNVCQPTKAGSSVASPGCRRFRSRDYTIAIVTPRVALKALLRGREGLEGCCPRGSAWTVSWGGEAWLAFTLHAFLARRFGLAGFSQCGVDDLDVAAALIVRDHHARARDDAGAGQLVAVRRRAVRE